MAGGSAAPSPAQVMQLFKALLREARKFSNYNVREYVKRRTIDGFQEYRGSSDSAAIAAAYDYGKQQLEIAKRQAIVYNLYAPRVKSIMDLKLKPSSAWIRVETTVGFEASDSLCRGNPWWCGSEGLTSSALFPSLILSSLFQCHMWRCSTGWYLCEGRWVRVFLSFSFVFSIGSRLTAPHLEKKIRCYSVRAGNSCFDRICWFYGGKKENSLQSRANSHHMNSCCAVYDVRLWDNCLKYLLRSL